jgi:chromate transporter
VLWAAPFLILLAWRGWGDVLVQEAVFFTKAAFVTFGGAYAVLSYIAEFSVGHGWLTAQQMLIGLGLAESTPGPLIMVTQYVGFLGGWTQAGHNPQLLNAIMGALITTYVTFLPCFFFIFAGAPYIETLSGNPGLQAALGGVTAAVVGVMLNLGVYFGEKILFRAEAGMDWFALAAMGISLVLLYKLKIPLQIVIGLGAAAGVARILI